MQSVYEQQGGWVHMIHVVFDNNIMHGGYFGGGYDPHHRQRRQAQIFHGGKSQHRQLSVCDSNKYGYIPPDFGNMELKKSNDKLLEIFYQVQWAALRLIILQSLTYSNVSINTIKDNSKEKQQQQEDQGQESDTLTTHGTKSVQSRDRSATSDMPDYRMALVASSSSGIQQVINFYKQIHLY